MALIQDHSQESLDKELQRVDTTQRGINTAVEQAREIVSNLQSELRMSEKDAKLALLASVKDEAEKDGATLEDVYRSYPAALREYIQYTPEDLRRNQLVTVAGTAVSAVSFLASFAIGALAVFKAVRVTSKATPALLKMLKNPRQQLQLSNALQLVKMDVGRKVALLGVTMAATTALAWLASTAVNNWNDVFHWGPQMAESQARDVMKDLQKLGYGSGTGAGGFNVPNPEDLVPTKTTTKTARHKMFLGTVLAGRVATGPVYIRGTDDPITNDEELETDANNELVKWLASLPSRMAWEIQMKNEPFDEYNVKRPGFWATLSLYMNGKGGTRMFVDEILLGPVEPKRYWPDYSLTESVRMALDKLSMPAELHAVETGPGGVNVTTADGTKVAVLPDAPEMTAVGQNTTAQNASGAAQSTGGGTSTTPNTGASASAAAAAAASGKAPSTGMGAVEVWPGMTLGEYVPALGVRKFQVVTVDTPGSTLALRKEPGTDKDLIVRIPHGSKVAAYSSDVAQADGYTWTRVLYEAGTKKAFTGWIAWDYVSAT